MRMRESEDGVIHARDRECTRCAREGKHTTAVCFVGLNDPDGTQYPVCRMHADEWHHEVMMAMCGMNPDGTKMREDESC